MIAFGTVSGGAGAAMTGGNFWQGAVAGLVVSGLNHFAHKMQEASMLEKAIRAGGFGEELDNDPYLNWSNEKIKEFASKVFPELFKSANSPDFEKTAIIDGDMGIAGRALKEVTLNSNGKFTVKSLGKILIRSNVLNSIKHLASVVGHELNHVQDYISGYYSDLLNTYGKTLGPAYSETKAYGWEECMGSPYLNRIQYNHFLNLVN
jgi:hypothetical protein